MTTDPTALVANSQDLTIDQRFTPLTIRRASRFSYNLGTDVVDIQIGVLPCGSNLLERLTLTVPMRRLLNGRKSDCIRTIRFNHLVNIISSWAAEVHDIDLKSNSVIFLGFGG